MQHLFDVKKTQLEMISDRGYDISEEEAILTMSIVEFKDYVDNLANANPHVRPRFLLSHFYKMKLPDGTTQIALVLYRGKSDLQQKQVPAETAREFINLIQKYLVNEAILIIDAPLSSIGEKELSALTLTKWQIFFDYELTYNCTKHVDNPRHELLSKEEAQEKLRELRVDLSGLLIIKMEDPVARYYGWLAGSLIRINRNDYTINVLAPKSINYRVVVG